ncbi:LytTR family transcriptional regulator [Corallococcus sp. CA054B]|nr:LytTR family transcriptional regulator [Corallococcus sp. CA054B]
MDRRIMADSRQRKGNARQPARASHGAATTPADWMAAEDNYVQVHVGERSHLLRQPMRQLEARLDPERFVRIHRSTLVNLQRVQELRPLPHGEYQVILRDRTTLKLSRGYRERLGLLLAQG